MSIYPTVRPSLTLDFQKSKQLDPRISFSRSSTATYVEGGVVNYADEHQARFEEEGLLIEESRTNYCKNYSNFFYAHSNATIAPGTSPAGDNTAQVITATANGMTSTRTTGGLKPVNIPTNSVGITCSLYVKGSYSYFRLKIFAGTSSQQQVTFNNFNTDSWTVSSNNSASKPSSNYQVQAVGNGWYRLSFYASNYTYATSIGALWFDGSASLSAGDTYSVWMPQVEVGKFPTSAIPTEVASEVTRAADLCNITGENFSSWYNQSEGSLVVEYSDQGFPKADGGNKKIVTISENNLTLMSSFKGYSLGNSAGADEDKVRFVWWDDDGRTYGAKASTLNKAAIAYSSDPTDGLAYDGTIVTTRTNGQPKNTMIGLYFFQYQTISRLAYYSEKLTNAQLEAITL